MGNVCKSDASAKVEESAASQSAPEAAPSGTKLHDGIDKDTVRQLLLKDDEAMKKALAFLEDKDALEKAWGELDGNGNGNVSLSEITAFVKGQEWAVDADAMREAYKYATAGGDDFVQRNEFARLLRALLYMQKLQVLFKKMDASGDANVDLPEFESAFAALGYPLTAEAAVKEFESMDKNDSGNVRYPEFCRYMAKVVSPMQMDLE